MCSATIRSQLIQFLYFVFLSALVAACGGGGAGGSGSSNNSGGSGSTNTLSQSTCDPANATAADSTQDVARGTTVSLDGSIASGTQYTWTQTCGPDVTSGTGHLSGQNPSFTAPDTVSTLIFTVTATDGSGQSQSATVQVNVLNRLTDAFYVDGDNGSDSTGDGSRAKPFATISHALNSIPGPDYDIYVKTLANKASYDESAGTLTPPTGTSLFGGYGANWVRDVVSNQTRVKGNTTSVSFVSVNEDTWFSGFDLTVPDSSNASISDIAIQSQSGTATLHIEDNTITVGNVGPGVSSNPGSSYGVMAANLAGVRILRDTITTGNGGNGGNGAQPSMASSGGNGGNASTTDTQAGGGGSANGTADVHGGCGGNGGGAYASGSTGCNGAGIFDPGYAGVGSSQNAGGATGGGGGTGGVGGNGATGNSQLTSNGVFSLDPAASGTDGDPGSGGGGGGGGGSSGVLTGGGGGGGGAGGQGGVGGGPGIGGGASLGIAISNVPDAIIEYDVITSGNGGTGGNGGAGGEGGNGGTGGTGGNGACFIACAYGGGGGGGGGKGGEGGQGGGGAGGPSFPVMVGMNTTITIQDNQLISGGGGAPGQGGLGGRQGFSGNAGVSADSNSNQGGGGGSASTTYHSRNTPSLRDGSNGSTASGGWSYGIFDADSTDGAPSVSGNTITTGTAGTGGSSGQINF